MLSQVFLILGNPSLPVCIYLCLPPTSLYCYLILKLQTSLFMFLTPNMMSGRMEERQRKNTSIHGKSHIGLSPEDLGTGLVSDLQRNRTERACVCVCVCACAHIRIKGEIYFKELAYATVRAGKSEICKTGWQAGNSGESGCCSLKSQGDLAEFLLP